MHTTLQERENVTSDDRWKVEKFYKTWEDWEKDLNDLIKDQKNEKWPILSTYKNRLNEKDILYKAVKEILDIDRKLSSLYTYAHLRHDEDIGNDKNKRYFLKITSLAHDFRQETSWFEPELLSLSNDRIQQLLSQEDMKPYHFYLEKIIRMKPHTLTTEQEEILAFASKAMQTSYKAFSSINDADFKFGQVEDAKGNKKELTHASYGLFLRDQDRKLRKNAFTQFHNKYMDFENTLTELLRGKIESHIFNAKVRKFPSSLHAALFPNQIDTQVYHSLIKSVNENLDALHDYVNLRKAILNVETLHYYDLSVPLSKDIDIKMTYDDAVEAIIESVFPLGNEYQSLLQKGLTTEGWVDRYENKRKRSGGYSSGCYDSMPYILMNYNGTLRDVFTLAHEGGHSMHSLFSNRHQSYQDSSYPIFLAEVASTFNEALLTNYLLQKSQSAEEKFYLINQEVEGLRTTLFRQTQFAEFELWLHQMLEENIPLTPGMIKEYYVELNKKYFGPDLVLDSEIAIEWARIPHFYYNFYVYQYATGISAAATLAEKVLSGGDKAQQDYLNFLKSGCSDYPINLLVKAGVDMRSPEPVETAINKFRRLVKELKDLKLEV